MSTPGGAYLRFYSREHCSEGGCAPLYLRIGVYTPTCKHVHTPMW
nr:MAG TPA: hypothetical protein [Caudoviricetes sp.]DAX45213.1 MAG TPA: hypothetical protein [Caudoviricetes sp.]